MNGKFISYSVSGLVKKYPNSYCICRVVKRDNRGFAKWYVCYGHYENKDLAEKERLQLLNKGLAEIVIFPTFDDDVVEEPELIAEFYRNYYNR